MKTSDRTHISNGDADLDSNNKLAILANVETTVLAARNNLSALLRRAEQGEEVIIRRGRGPQAKAFRLIAVEPLRRRTLKADPRWKGRIIYKDEDILASEWSDESC